MKFRRSHKWIAFMLSVMLIVTSVPSIAFAENLRDAELIVWDDPAQETERVPEDTAYADAGGEEDVFAPGEEGSDDEEIPVTDTDEGTALPEDREQEEETVPEGNSPEAEETGSEEFETDAAAATTTVNSWSGLQSAVSTAKDGDVIELSGDIINNNNGDRINVALGHKSITIDLKGFTVSRKRTSSDEDGHVFEVQNYSTLTIIDTSTEQTGTITGGWSTNGGGINIHDGSTVNLQGGIITGNHAEYGGGIFSNTTLEITGGSITNNEAKECGGGIRITDENSKTTITGSVTISGNTAKEEHGGGIYAADSSKEIRLQGGPVVKENNAAEDKNLYLSEEIKLTVTGALTQDKNRPLRR